jgi:hypothetical protein
MIVIMMIRDITDIGIANTTTIIVGTTTKTTFGVFTGHRRADRLLNGAGRPTLSGRPIGIGVTNKKSAATVTVNHVS